MSIGSRIKERRIFLSLTQEELAKQIGITKGAIANYENQVSVPKMEILFKLFEILKCDANYLYQDDVNPQININFRNQHYPSFEEQNHLKKYRTLDDKGKHTVDVVLDMEHKRCTETVTLTAVARGGMVTHSTLNQEKADFILSQLTPSDDDF